MELGRLAVMGRRGTLGRRLPFHDGAITPTQRGMRTSRRTPPEDEKAGAHVAPLTKTTGAAAAEIVTLLIR